MFFALLDLCLGQSPFVHLFWSGECSLRNLECWRCLRRDRLSRDRRHGCHRFHRGRINWFLCRFAKICSSRGRQLVSFLWRIKCRMFLGWGIRLLQLLFGEIFSSCPSEKLSTTTHTTDAVPNQVQLSHFLSLISNYQPFCHP